MPHKVFIGSSSESLPIARAIQAELKSYSKEFSVTIWNQQVVNASRYTIPELIKEISNSRYATFVFSDDDVLKSRRVNKKAARDNVIYECGLAAGILGLDNCFVFKSREVTLPSDFEGLTVLNFDLSNDELNTYENIQSEIGPAVNSFVNSVHRANQSDIDIENKMIPWSQYCESVAAICKKLSRSPRQGGFRFDAIVGIARGGVIAADLINRKFLTKAPLFCLFPDYISRQPNISFSTPNTSINEYIFEALKDFQCILVVDDITRTGQTITRATDLLKTKLPGKNIKSAVVYVAKAYKDKIDYFGTSTTDTHISMPYSIFD